MTTKTPRAAMTHGFLNKVWSPDGRDSGNAEDDQAVNEYFPDLGNLAVDGQHAGRSGGASPSGQVEHPAPVNQRPEATDGADDVQ